LACAKDLGRPEWFDEGAVAIELPGANIGGGNARLPSSLFESGIASAACAADGDGEGKRSHPKDSRPPGIYGQPIFVEPCAVKTALLADVKAAIGDLVAIHNAEFEALIREDFTDIEVLRARLRVARERKVGLIEILYRAAF